MKSKLGTLFKILLAFGLVYWMIRSDRLDFAQLKILVTRYDIFLLNLMVWICVPLLLGSYRWFTLLRGIGLYPTFFRTLQLQLIGFFFNTAIPGAVGGDIVKAVYIMREQGTKRRTPALMTILLDRIVGLFGLFTVGTLAIVFGAHEFADKPQFRPLLIFVLGFCVAMIFGSILVLMPYKDGKDPFLKLLQFRFPGREFFEKLYATVRQYRSNPTSLAKAYLLSILIQFLNLCYFLVLTQVMLDEPVENLKVAVIFPIGILTTALPISPGGIGVGHGAFEFLFHQIGLSNGANVFNVFCLGQLALNLLGVLVYLFSKSDIPDLQHLEQELQTE